jgi:hypothetical protein
VYCTHCGSAISGEDVFCRKCGAAQTLHSPVRATGSSEPAQQVPERRPASVAEPTASGPHPAIPLAVVGFLVGGFIGFAMRPSALLVGQLPFGTVITGGANLTGLDQLLQPTAQNSFNLMLTAAIVGAVAGGIVGLLIKLQPSRRG